MSCMSRAGRRNGGLGRPERPFGRPLKRVSVHRGAKDPLALALDRVSGEIKELAEAVKDDLQGRMDKTRCDAAWNAVEKAELSFYSATEDVLSLVRPVRRRITGNE